MTKQEKALIKELKEKKDGMHEFTEDGVHYRILIINRGEGLFFQMNDAGILCDISARFAVIAEKTLKEWDNGEKVTDETRPALVEKIKHFYKLGYKDELTEFDPKRKYS